MNSTSSCGGFNHMSAAVSRNCGRTRTPTPRALTARKASSSVMSSPRYAIAASSAVWERTAFTAYCLLQPTVRSSKPPSNGRSSSAPAPVIGVHNSSARRFSCSARSGGKPRQCRAMLASLRSSLESPLIAAWIAVVASANARLASGRGSSTNRRPSGIRRSHP